MSPSCAELRQHVRVIADGVELELPQRTQGVILLNINSYAGGVRMWDKGGARQSWWGINPDETRALRGSKMNGARAEDGDAERRRSVSVASRLVNGGGGGEFGESLMEDGMVDVVVVYGALHLGQLSWGTEKPTRLCQARNVRLVLDKGLPVQVDGQPWKQPPGKLDVRLRHRATVLTREREAQAAVGGDARLEWGWEEWEDLDYYDDHDAKSSVLRFC